MTSMVMLKRPREWQQRRRRQHKIILESDCTAMSLEPELVIRQIRQAHDQGFREVTLTGIHIAHYGWDLNTDLMELLHKVFEETEGVRIRLTTLDPFEIPDSLIALRRSWRAGLRTSVLRAPRLRCAKTTRLARFPFSWVSRMGPPSKMT